MRLNDEIAVIGDEETLSFRQLCVLIDRLSIELRSQGISAGATVVMLVPMGWGISAAC